MFKFQGAEYVHVYGLHAYIIVIIIIIIIIPVFVVVI
jgi:hypothetical protein